MKGSAGNWTHEFQRSKIKITTQIYNLTYPSASALLCVLMSKLQYANTLNTQNFAYNTASTFLQTLSC